MGIPTWALSAKWIQRPLAPPGPQHRLAPPGKRDHGPGPFRLSTSSATGLEVRAQDSAEPLPHPSSPPVTDRTATATPPDPHSLELECHRDSSCRQRGPTAPSYLRCTRPGHQGPARRMRERRNRKAADLSTPLFRGRGLGGHVMLASRALRVGRRCCQVTTARWGRNCSAAQCRASFSGCKGGNLSTPPNSYRGGFPPAGLRPIVTLP